jgi:phosphatidate cytidylyltransferase
MVDDNGLPPDPDEEGIRIIGPDEAAEAVERGDVAQRRSGDQPRYGDRPSEPESQPKGPRPTLRFPLPDAGDPAADRPKVKPPTAPRDEPKTRSLFSVGGGEAGGGDGGEADDPREPEADDRAADDELLGELVAEAPAPTDESGPIKLPHWTEPATGEIPRVLIGDRDDEPAEEDWLAFADGGPRWRDDSKDFDERDDIAVLSDDDARVGALDPDAPGEHELLSFDDLSPAAAPRPAGTRRAPAKVPAKRIDSGGRRPGEPGGRPPGAVGRERPAPAGRGPSGGDRDLTMAIGVGAALGVGALVALKIGPGVMMAVVSGVVLLAAAEFFTTTRRAGYAPAQLLGIVACVVLPLATFWKDTLAFPVVLGLAAMCGFLWYIVGAGEERPTMNLGVTSLGILWIGVLGSFAGLLLGMPDGSSVMLSVLVVAVAHDVGAFFVGRSLGRAPLTPISPGKTVEGLFGGIVAAIVASVIIVGLPDIGPFGVDFWDAFWLGLVVGVATAIGDLCESVVKRDLGVKDMGNILPGHGGVLDRMDGILFAMPAAWYLSLVLFG